MTSGSSLRIKPGVARCSGEKEKPHVKSWKSSKMCEPIFSRLRNLRSLRKQNFTPVQSFSESRKVKIPFLGVMLECSLGVARALGGGAGEAGSAGVPSRDPTLVALVCLHRGYFMIQESKRSLVVPCSNPARRVEFSGTLSKAMSVWALPQEILIQLIQVGDPQVILMRSHSGNPGFSQRCHTVIA